MTRPKRRNAAARKAKAQARLEGSGSPAIQPGMQGGQYRPLSDDELIRIHAAALTILENTGIGDPLPELLDIVLPLGATLNDHGRLCFPKSMIEDIIAGAGGAAHLPGMVAAATSLPVIGVAVPLKQLDGLDSLLSIVQMPSGVPVATVGVGNARNAGLLAIRILATHNEALRKRTEEFQESLRQIVTEKDQLVQDKLGPQ